MIRRALAHLGLVLFGLVLGLLLLETGLRLAALLVRGWYAFESPTPSAARVRILSLGDSNTFGLHVGKVRAYPQLLEARWNAEPDRRGIDVVNAGYPGFTSWSIRGRLGDLLAAYRPEVVTIMIGANDSWRDHDPRDDVSVDACVARAETPVDPPEAPHATGWRLMRVLRLFEPLLPQPLEHLHGDPGGRTPHFDPRWPNDLLANLGFIAACIERAGAQVVFLTYPASAHPYDIANDAMRLFSLRTRMPLVDLGHRLAPQCPRSKCDYLFQDQHPTIAGHAWVAETLVGTLPDAVRSLGPDPAASSRMSGPSTS